MKLSKLFFGVAAAAMFAACSSDDVATGALDEMFDSDGNAYMRVAISVPSEAPATRAAGYDDTSSDPQDQYGNYSDGDEYAVKDVTLLIFGQKTNATPEADFEFIKGYQLPTTPDFVTNSDRPITSTQKSKSFAISKDGMAGYTKLWAMIVLNKSDRIVYTPDGAMMFNSGTINGTAFAAHDHFSAFRDAAVTVAKGKASDFATSGYMMTNMPYANNAVPASVTAINTLYPIDNAKIYPTKSEADADDEVATTVYVERINSKIVVTEDIATQKLEGVSYEFGDWFVDNYAKDSYLTRHCERPGAVNPFDYLAYVNTGSHVNALRFMHTTPVTDGAYRTDFAFDMDYNDGVLTNLSGKATSYSDAKTVAMGSPYYFTENTFDVAHQTEPNTTRVVIPVKFNSGSPFYTVNVEPNKAYSPADMKTWVLARALEISELTTWFAENYTGALSATNIDKFITATIGTATGTGNHVTFTLAAPATLPAGVTGYQLGKSQSTAESSKSATVTKLSTLASSYDFSYFGDGYAYYPILIQHFGDYDTPWSSTSSMVSNTVDQIYGYTSTPAEQLQAEKNFLGRYGVVRNNWYRIRVSSLEKMGSPTIPAINATNNTDDKIENAYIKYEINIVPWVLRGIQDANL